MASGGYHRAQKVLVKRYHNHTSKEICFLAKPGIIADKLSHS